MNNKVKKSKKTCFDWSFMLKFPSMITRRCVRLPIHEEQLSMVANANSHNFAALVFGFLHGAVRMEGGHKMANNKIRIRLKAFDHKIIDQAAAKIIEAAMKSGAKVSGPIPLPTEREVVTILRAVHKYKDSREQFETRTHKRLIELKEWTPATITALENLQLAAGVEVEVKA